MVKMRRLGVSLSRDGENLLYNAPEGAMTSCLRIEIAERKQEILAFLADAENKESINPPVIPRFPPRSPQPLSFGQESMWQVSEDLNGPCNIAFLIRFRNGMDADILRDVISEILRRHEVLRTVYRNSNNGMRQIVTERTIDIPQIDITNARKADQETVCRRIATEIAVIPFDLTKELPVRALIIHLAQSDLALAVSIHHIACDLVSIGIFVNELKLLCKAFQEGNPSPLDELPIQYSDYAQWQRTYPQGRSESLHWNYWQDLMKECHYGVSLPTDNSLTQDRKYRVARQTTNVANGSLVNAYTELSKKQGVTLHMTFNAVARLFLHHLTGQRKILLSHVAGNRWRPEFEGLIGMLVTPILILTELDADLSFIEFLQQVRKMTLCAYEHGEAPISRVLKDVSLREAPCSPMLHVDYEFDDSSLTWRPSFSEYTSLGGNVEVIQLSTKSQPNTIDGWEIIEPHTDLLRLRFFKETTGIHVTIGYSTDLFEHHTITRMLEDLATLVAMIPSNLYGPVNDSLDSRSLAFTRKLRDR